MAAPKDRPSPRTWPAARGGRKRLQVCWFRLASLSCPVDRSDQAGIDVNREWPCRVVDDPNVQHRRRAYVDGPDGTDRERRHQAELEPEGREADVLVLVPCRQWSAGIRSELVQAWHLEHRA